MATIICPNCKAELSEYKRFCPECGARLPEEAPATSPVAPTVILPPADAPPRPPVAVPPTVRLDAPQEETVVVPPAGAPPVQPSSFPAPQEETVVVPPAQPSPVGALPPVGQVPPAGAPPVQPSPVGALPPVGQIPPAGGLSLPPAGTPAAAPPSGRRGPLFWWLIGGAGCISLVLVGICAIGLLTLLGQRVSQLDPTAQPGAATTTGGGGIVPGDSPLTGGAVLLEDDFDNPAASELAEDEDETARYAFDGGVYVVEVKEPQTLVWALFEGSYSDARFAVDTEVPPGADESAAGLVFHYQDNRNFYLFSVSNDGYYALEILEDNEWFTLIDWTQSDAVDAVRNRIEVATQGDRIALYVNGELLEETSDGTFTEGEVGLAVTSLEDSTAEIHFDNMLITENE